MRGRKPVISQFLIYLEKKGINNLSKVTKGDLNAYIPIIADSNPRSIGSVLSALRCFLRFSYQNKLIETDLVSTLQVVASKRRKIKIGFTNDEVGKILHGINRETAGGKRDYAILMLAKYTGLRAVDVLALRLSDINWANHEISVIQSKTASSLILPLETVVGNAIADYILHGRPTSNLSYIFLRLKVPYTELKSWSGYSIVKRNANRVGIEWSNVERKGFHSFRRSLGNWMLEAEIPLTTISEILGHAQLNSTKPYISTGFNKLQTCPLTLRGIEVGREELL